MHNTCQGMTMQCLDKPVKTVKGKQKGGGANLSRKTSSVTMKERDTPPAPRCSSAGAIKTEVSPSSGGVGPMLSMGSDGGGGLGVAVKLESEHMNNDGQLDNAVEFNGHNDGSNEGIAATDVKPKLDDGSVREHGGLTNNISDFKGHDGPFGGPPSAGPPGDASAASAMQRMQMMGSNGPMSMPGSSPMPRMIGMPNQGSGHLQLSAGGHFMQLQNQIFVFTTDMANRAADAVQCGQFKNILEYHVSHPGTQQQLQKLNAQLAASGSHCMMFDGTGGMRLAGGGQQQQPAQLGDKPGAGSALANVAHWVQEQNANLQQERTSSAGGGLCPQPDSANIPPGMKSNGQFRGGMEMGGGPPGYGLGPGGGGPGPGGMQGFAQENDLLHSKVPNENLTPQQLRQREEKMANMRKIKQMLFPEQQGQSPVDGMSASGLGGPMMMHPGGMPCVDGMPLPPDMWPPPEQHFMHPGGMGGMMSDEMGFPPGMGGPPGPLGMPMGMVPPNWENMNPAQREWFKLQQEHYMEKYRKQQMQQMSGGGPGGSPCRGFYGPPMHHRMGPGGGRLSPVSPSFVGPPHCGPHDFPPGAGFPHPMCPDGGYDPRGMPPDGMFPFHDGPGMMGPRMGPGGMPQDQFNPELAHMMRPGGCPPGHGMGGGCPPGGHGMGGGGMMKMAPGYGVMQSQKRKRSSASITGGDGDDICKRLLPAPSPQQFSYVDPLEGQELVITKQVNLAFQEQLSTTQSPPAGNAQQQLTYPPPPKARAPAAKKKKTKASEDKGKSRVQPTPPQPSMTGDNFACPSPAVSSISTGAVTPSLSNVASPTSQTSSGQQPQFSRSQSCGGQTGGDQSKGGDRNPLSNITSSSLIDLARGVENLPAQIGLHAGGPFRAVQLQENESDASNGSPLAVNQSGGGGTLPGHAKMGPMDGSMTGNQESHDRLMNRTSSASGVVHPGDMFPMDDPSCMDPRFGGFGPGVSAGMGGQHGGGGMNIYNSMGPSPGGNAGQFRVSRPPRNSSVGMVTGNAKIQIQAQAPNTIQYMPSSSSAPGEPGDVSGRMSTGGVDHMLDLNSMDMGKPGASKQMMFDMMHGGGGPTRMSPVEMMQRQRQQQMDMQMMQEAGLRAEMSGGGGYMGPNQRGQLHSGGPPMHMMMHPGGRQPGGAGSPLLMGPDGPMHRGAGSMHGDARSPMLGQMHGGSGSPMLGSGGHMMSASEMLQMQGQGGMMMMGPGGGMMGPSGGNGPMMHDFPHQMGGPGGVPMMGPGGPMMGSQADMGHPMGLGRRGMHPDSMGPGGPMRGVMCGPGGPGDFGMMRGGDMMGPGRPSDMAMMNMMSAREAMRSGDGGGGGGVRGGGGMLMRGGPRMEGPPAAAPTTERTKSTKSSRAKQKNAEAAAAAAAAAANEARLRMEAPGGMQNSRMGGANSGPMDGMMGGGVMHPEMGMMVGGRGDMMGGDRLLMRPDQGMLRGNGMPPSEMMMMQQQQQQQQRMGGMPGGMHGGGMMDGGSMNSEMMFGFAGGGGGGRRSMDSFDMGGGPPGMRPGGNGGPGGDPGGGEMMGGGGGGYPAHFQQFQQQLYAQNRSPQMSPAMQAMRNSMASEMNNSRGGMDGGMGRPTPDMIGRPNVLDSMGRSVDGMIRTSDMMGRPVDTASLSRHSDSMGRLSDMMGRPVDTSSLSRHSDSMGRLSEMMLRPMDGMSRDAMGRPVDGSGRPMDMMMGGGGGGGQPYDMIGNGQGMRGGQGFVSSPPGMNSGSM